MKFFGVFIIAVVFLFSFANPLHAATGADNNLKFGIWYGAPDVGMVLVFKDFQVRPGLPTPIMGQGNKTHAFYGKPAPGAGNWKPDYRHGTNRYIFMRV